MEVPITHCLSAAAIVAAIGVSRFMVSNKITPRSFTMIFLVLQPFILVILEHNIAYEGHYT